MALTFENSLRTVLADAMETDVGTSPKLKIYTAAFATMLVSMDLPSDWLGAASDGVKTKAGTWSGTAAAGGDAAVFRIYKSDNTTLKISGTVSGSGGSGDIKLQQVASTIVEGQTVTISSATYTAGNAA